MSCMLEEQLQPLVQDRTFFVPIVSKGNNELVPFEPFARNMFSIEWNLIFGVALTRS